LRRAPECSPRTLAFEAIPKRLQQQVQIPVRQSAFSVRLPTRRIAEIGGDITCERSRCVKFIASTVNLLRQNQPGDLCPRPQQVFSVGVPIVPTSGNLFHHVVRHRPASALRQNREVFVIFQPFPDLLQSD